MPIEALSQLQGLPTGAPPVLGKKPKGNFFTGTPAYTQQFSRYNPYQLGAQEYLLGQGLKNADPQALQKQAEERFYKKTVPTLAERFTSMGAGGQASSAFQNALGEAGVGLEGELAGLTSNIGLQQLMQGLQQQYDTSYTPRQGGFFENLLGGFTGGQGGGVGIANIAKLLSMFA